MSWLVLLLAATGAALILGALTFVSALIGGLITAMIVLMCGPLIDRMVAKRRSRGSLDCRRDRKEKGVRFSTDAPRKQLG